MVAGIVLAACAAALVRHGSERPPADPCDAHPDTYACAMFAQPEWLKRRVYAGRQEMRAVAAPVLATDVAAAVSGDDGEPAVDGI